MDSERARAHKTLWMAKWLLVMYFVVCLWLNYDIDSISHLSASHLLTVALVFVALAVTFYRPKITVRFPWGTKTDRIFWGMVLPVLLLRTLMSFKNEFFVGQATKIILIAVGVICFKLLDPEGKLFRFFAHLLPIILAIGIVCGILFWLASGKLGVERFR